MNKNPSNFADLQEMIQRYRDELLKANKRKTLPDTENSAPTSPAESVYRPPVPQQAPQEAPRGTSDRQTQPGTETGNTAAGPPNMPPVPNPADFFPGENDGPDPGAYWTPPCMQQNLNVPQYPPMDGQAPAQTGPMINQTGAATAEWPASSAFEQPEAAHYAGIPIPVDAPASNGIPPGITSFPPVITPEDTGTEFAVTPGSTASEQDFEHSQPVSLFSPSSEPQTEPVLSPSQLWPRDPEGQREDAGAAVATAAPLPASAEAAETEAPTPSLLRPNIPLWDTSENFTAAAEQTSATPEAEDMGNALLQLHVTTGRQATPVPNARAVIFKPDGDKEVLVKILTTDKSGNTPAVPLPAVQAKYSLHSGSARPTLYIVETTAPGYYHTRHIHMPMYGGVAAVQEIELTPLAEGDDGAQELVYDQQPPEGTE